MYILYFHGSDVNNNTLKQVLLFQTISYLHSISSRINICKLYSTDQF